MRCTWSAGGRCQHSWAQPRGGSWPLPRGVALARCPSIGFQEEFFVSTNFFIFLNIQGLNWVSPNTFRMGCCSWEGCKGFVVSIHLLKLYSSFPESALFISRPQICYCLDFRLRRDQIWPPIKGQMSPHSAFLAPLRFSRGSVGIITASILGAFPGNWPI